MAQFATAHPNPAYPTLSATIALLKPITWFAPMWAFGCGVVASGVPLQERWVAIVLGILLAGPLVCGASQAANDWYDRFVDAINEPHRVVPSGRMPGRWAFYIAAMASVISLWIGYLLGPWVLGATVVGLVLAWIYSAPPLRLKRNGWLGAAAVGLCYEGLPWFTAAAAAIGGYPGHKTLIIALLYSIGAHGIMTLNDFKAVEGDRRMGLASLPVTLGTDRACRVACFFMAAAQFAVVALLIVWGAPVHAAIVAALIVVQLGLMRRLLADPEGRAAWYNATGTTLYVLGMLAAAFALRGVQGGL
ncbi:chlorophyll synthase ChlG [Georhizobium sp. MAB10]|uniref:chlorophyll synthase ChlG n=1 Tax=Georhizobium sp. MAB10 TaxID=3028319 RepID=UPI003855F990